MAAHRYWKFLITDDNHYSYEWAGTNWISAISGIVFSDAFGGNNLFNMEGNFQTNINDYPNLMNTDISTIFDNDFDTYVGGNSLSPGANESDVNMNGLYFIVDLSAEYKRDIIEYKIGGYHPPDGHGPSVAVGPKSWEVSFSDDSVNWTVVHTVTDYTDFVTDEWFTFRIPNTEGTNFYLSGGIDNIFEYNSIGDAISAKKILSQKVLTTTVSGLSSIIGYGNTLGSGTLTYTAATGDATWQPFGGSVGSPIDLRLGGEYTLTDSTGEQFLTVDVDWENLSNIDLVDSSMNVINSINETFDDVNPAEGISGDTEYRCYYFKNTSLYKGIKNVKFWIEQQPSSSTLSIGLDPVDINGDAKIIADENSMPSTPAGVYTPATFDIDPASGFVQIDNIISGGTSSSLMIGNESTNYIHNAAFKVFHDYDGAGSTDSSIALHHTKLDYSDNLNAVADFYFRKVSTTLEVKANNSLKWQGSGTSGDATLEIKLEYVDEDIQVSFYETGVLKYSYITSNPYTSYYPHIYTNPNFSMSDPEINEGDYGELPIFVQPDSSTHQDVVTVSGILNAGDYIPLWVKREVPPYATYNLADVSSIGVAYTKLLY